MIYVNAEFLRRADLFLRLFERILKEPDMQKQFTSRLTGQLEELRQNGASIDAIDEYLTTEIVKEASARAN